LEEAVVAEQATGIVASTAGTSAVVHTTVHEEHNPGRPISWAGTVVTIIGFIIGGVAMVPAPHWVLFWVGAGVAIIGCLILLFSKAMNEDWY
jgi:hypothetical protein